MKPLVLICVALFFLACGPDRAMLMDTKFDASLKKRMEELALKEASEELMIQGKCMTVIDGLMRQDLIDAGADMQTMKGETFTAKALSDDVYDIAALEFVTQVQLSRK